MILCKYGCGREGIYPIKNFYGRKNNEHACASSFSKCPVYRKNSSENAKQMWNNSSVVEKERRISKRKETLSLVDESGQTGFTKNALAIAANRRNLDGSYKGIDKTVATKRQVQSDGLTGFESAAIKTAITRFGKYAGLEGKSEFEQYRRKVKLITNAQPLHLLEHIEKRGAHGLKDNPYQLDHKYSIVAGYLSNVPPEIIGHIKNLEMLPAKLNNAKGSACSISLNELIYQIQNFE